MNSAEKRNPAIVILDFGSQYSELIARRIRETEVYSLVMSYTTSADQLRFLAPKGIILSGGPGSVYECGCSDIADVPPTSISPILETQAV